MSEILTHWLENYYMRQLLKPPPLQFFVSQLSLPYDFLFFISFIFNGLLAPHQDHIFIL